jgi:c-di-GMP-binding flagellar brake protein YcgR
MNVIDVSQGGALGALANQRVPMSEDPVFKVGNKLKDIELVFPGEAETIMVQIKDAVIRRLGKDHVTGRDICAFQFMHIEKYPRKTLLELIYQFQRNILRNRPSDAA